MGRKEHMSSCLLSKKKKNIVCIAITLDLYRRSSNHLLNDLEDVSDHFEPYFSHPKVGKYTSPVRLVNRKDNICSNVMYTAHDRQYGTLVINYNSNNPDCC